jgi:hypothetical protein
LSYESLVREYLASGGNVTRVPMGKTQETTYIWDADKNDLVPLENGFGSWREQQNSKARNIVAARKARAATERRPDVIAARDRRNKVLAVAKDMTIREMSEMFGVVQKVIQTDLKVMGIVAKPAVSRTIVIATARRALVAEYVAKMPGAYGSQVHRAMVADGHDVLVHSVKSDMTVNRMAQT